MAIVIIYSRYYVAITLISYGMAKFWEGQFPGPGLHSLEQTYGNFSTMGLAWRFFGFSEAYKSFMGFAEIIPGLLLLFRRTVVLGALLAIAVITHIVLVNFSFDIPVKLFSSHLLVFSLVILSPFAVDIFRFFVLHKPVQLSISPFLIKTRRAKVSRILVKGFLILFIPVTMLVQRYNSYKFNAFDNELGGGIYGTNLTDKHCRSQQNPLEKVIVANKSFIGVNQQNESDYYEIKEIHEGGRLECISMERKICFTRLKFPRFRLLLVLKQQ